MLKKINYPIENSLTGPILKPVVYSNHDKMGNLTGPTKVRILDADFTVVHLSADIMYLTVSSATDVNSNPTFTFNGSVYQVGKGGTAWCTIIYLTSTYGFDTVIGLSTTKISGPGNDFGQEIDGNSVVGIESTGDNSTQQFYPGTIVADHWSEGSASDIANLRAYRNDSEPSSIWPPFLTDDGDPLSPSQLTVLANGDQGPLTLDLLIP